MGVQHVKGMLLYGPPGTGKTLIARQIGKMLNGKEPKVVNGPEILSKYVGQSEENIRNLFADADAEQAARGDDSDLHIIIFDEIDSVCKARGSSRDGTGVHDTVVNQLLSKIDGVNSLNNILLIGMTNRKDLIDEALLRPGRLEVHVEISLPDESGRLQILGIHTAPMREAKVRPKGVGGRRARDTPTRRARARARARALCTPSRERSVVRTPCRLPGPAPPPPPPSSALMARPAPPTRGRRRHPPLSSASRCLRTTSTCRPWPWTRRTFRARRLRDSSSLPRRSPSSGT